MGRRVPRAVSPRTTEETLPAIVHLFLAHLPTIANCPTPYVYLRILS